MLGLTFAVVTTVLGAASTAGADCPAGAATGFYGEARKAYEDKRFDDSVALLQRAYACDRNPVYLANIARSQEEANRPKDALAAWRDYLVVVTDPAERTRVEGRISALAKVVADLDRLEQEKEAAEQARLAAERDALARPPAPRSGSPPGAQAPAAAWLVGASGGVGMAAGAALWFVASSKHSTANQELAQEVLLHQSSQEAEKTNLDAQSLARAGNITFAAGAVVSAAGLAWAGVRLLRPAPSQTAMAVSVTGASIQLSGRF